MTSGILYNEVEYNEGKNTTKFIG